jgi:hypothetical protein
MLMEKKNSEEAIELFKTLSENSQQFSSRGKQGGKSNGMYEVNINDGVQTQMATMEKNIDMLVQAMKKISPVHQVQQVKVCAICSHSNHIIETCPMSSSSEPEQVNYVGQNNYPPKNNPYSNTYNAGWRNHPNLSWSSNQDVLNPQVGQPNLEPKKNDVEGVMLQFLTAQQQINSQTSQTIQKLEATTSQAIQRFEA